MLTLSEFSQIFLAALENLKLGLVPMASDMVLIGNVERSRQPDLRSLRAGALEGASRHV